MGEERRKNGGRSELAETLVGEDSREKVRTGQDVTRVKIGKIAEVDGRIEK